MPRFALRGALGLARSGALGLALVLAATTPATAQSAAGFPNHPVRIVVPFPPGGAADTFSRLLGAKLADAWGGQSVVIDNRPGAAGIIGTDAAAKSAPDGYTLLMVTVGHALNPAIYAKLPYDTTSSFVPVAWVANVPSLVVVGPSFEGRTLKDLLAQAKRSPQTITYASSGVGSTSHVGAALIESMGGVEMLHVPYKGASAALQDVMGGRVTMSVDIITSSVQLVKTQKLRALATTGVKRSPMLPEVPTVAEAGLPGYDFSAWYMLLAPARTPKAIVEKIHSDARKIASSPEFAAKIEEAGGEVATASLDDTHRFLNDEMARWAKLAKDKNIKAD